MRSCASFTLSFAVNDWDSDLIIFCLANVTLILLSLTKNSLSSSVEDISASLKNLAAFLYALLLFSSIFFKVYNCNFEFSNEISSLLILRFNLLCSSTSVNSLEHGSINFACINLDDFSAEYNSFTAFFNFSKDSYVSFSCSSKFFFASSNLLSTSMFFTPLKIPSLTADGDESLSDQTFADIKRAIALCSEICVFAIVTLSINVLRYECVTSSSMASNIFATSASLRTLSNDFGELLSPNICIC